MATLISFQNGSFTGVNFATVDTATGASALIRRSNPAFAGAGVSTSVTFTITNGAVIDGVLMWLGTPLYPPSVADGTLMVTLRKSGVVLASCTIDKCDLPPSPQYNIPQPVFFKLSNTVTGDGTSTYTLQVTTSGANGVWTYDNSGTSGDWTRALRTANYVAPAAGDNIYVVGEMTGRGTRNWREMVYSGTTPTVYGTGIVNTTGQSGGLLAIGAYATLTYGNNPNTNYVLRVSGDIWVGSYGTLTVGHPSFPIPRSSSAILEIQPVSGDTDFRFRFQDLAVFNTTGLSRTIGKDIVKCKLNANTTPFVNLRGGGVVVNGNAVGSAGPEASGNTMLYAYYSDNTTNGAHGINWTGPAVTNTTQTWRMTLTRGPGLNNRYFRITIGNNATFTSVTNGFYVDVDLQLGTIGAITGIGNGSGASASIAQSSHASSPYGPSYIITLTGVVSTAATTPYIHVMVGNAAGNVSYAGNTTICYFYTDPWVTTAASIADTTLSVDTDTGWLRYDAVALASTSRTAGECEIFPLSVDAAASLLTSQVPSIYAHSGASPTQAELALITRNVKIRSTNPGWMVSILATQMSTMNCSWTEFAYMGNNSGGYRGINIDSGPGPTFPKTFQFCSLHDFRQWGFFTDANTNSFNTNISYTTFWNCSTPFQINNPLNYADWTVDNCLAIWNPGHGFCTVDAGGSITNCTAVGGTNNSNSGFYYSEGGGVVGRFANNTSHSGYGSGLRIDAGAMGLRAENFTAWRNVSFGVYVSGNYNNELTFDNLTVFGPTTYGMYVEASASINITGNSFIGSDTSFTTVNGIWLQNAGAYILNLNGLDMQGGTGIFLPPTNAFNGTYGFQHLKIVTSNCKFGAGIVVPPAYRANWSRQAHISHQRYNQVANDHRTEMKYGQIKIDPSIYNLAVPSTRVTPSSATIKMESAPPGDGALVQVNNGTKRLLSVAVRKSVAADGFAYNGNQPRLIQRANPALGQPYDVVLAACTLPNGVWDTMTAQTSSPTDNGAFEYVVDGDGTGGGFFNVDDYGIKVADPTVLTVYPPVMLDADNIKPTQPSPFNVLTDLTGVIGWWDASVFAGFTLSGSNILTVADQSGNGKTMTISANFARPTYNALGFLSQPAMMFAGALNQMLEAQTVQMGTSNTLTFWWVGYYTSNSSGACRFMSYTAAGQGHDYQNDLSWDLERISNGVGVQLVRNGGITSTTAAAYSMPVRIILTISNTGVTTLYVNGVQSGTPGTKNANWGNNGSVTLGNGKFEGNWLDGVIAEAGVATGYSDSLLVGRLDNFLKSKWKFDGLGVSTVVTDTETFPVVSVIQPGFVFPNMIDDMPLETLPAVEAAFPFTPTNFSSLIGWWDASVGGSIAYDTGVNINTIADQSGGGRTLTWVQARPTYNATGLAGVKPAIVFDVSSANALQHTTFPMGTGNTLTAWFVGTMPGSSVQNYGRALSYSRTSGSNDYDNANSWCVTSVGTSTSQMQYTHNSISGQATGLAVIPSIHRVIYTINADGTNTLYVDGIAYGVTNAPASWISGGVLAVGRQANTGQYWTGNMGEWGVALDDCNAVKVAKLDGYLRNKWNMPLDTLSAAPTGAWSPSRKLKSSFNSTTYYAATTGSVDTLYDQSGAGLNLTAASTERPTIATAGPNSITCLSCDGNDLMAHANNMTSLYSTDTGYMIASIRPTGWVNNNTTYWQTSRILGDSGGNSGMYAAGTGTTGRYYAGIYGGTTQLETAMTTDTVYVVEWRHQNGFLYSRVNGGIEQLVAYGTGMGMGNIQSCQIIGQIFEMAAFATPPTLAERNALVQAFGTYVGAAVI